MVAAEKLFLCVLCVLCGKSGNRFYFFINRVQDSKWIFSARYRSTNNKIMTTRIDCFYWCHDTFLIIAT